MRSHNETLQPRHAVVMLGASNLSRAFPVAVSTAQRVFGSPLSIYAAKGHGRSFGQESSCLGKKISGIFSCGIWRALQREKSVPITALVTDIGNDLAYEVPVETVLEWVEGCVDRLLALDARVVISDLPIEVLRSVSATRYRCFRTLLFPQCRLSWSEMLRRAELLSQRLHTLAEKREMPVFLVQNEWYGLDPIHPRRRDYAEYWAELLSLAAGKSIEHTPLQKSLSWRWYLRSLSPESWSTFGFSRRASQPNGRLTDGTAISLY